MNFLIINKIRPNIILTNWALVLHLKQCCLDFMQILNQFAYFISLVKKRIPTFSL